MRPRFDMASVRARAVQRPASRSTKPLSPLVRNGLPLSGPEGLGVALAVISAPVPGLIITGPVGN